MLQNTLTREQVDQHHQYKAVVNKVHEDDQHVLFEVLVEDQLVVVLRKELETFQLE